MKTELIPAESKKTVLLVQKQANDLQVTNPDQAEIASELLHQIKDAAHTLSDVKNDITKPQMEALARVKALFAPHETALKQASDTVRAKVVAYEIEKAEAAEVKQARIDARVAKGTMRPDTAVAKLGEIESSKLKTSGIRVKTRRVLEITDESLIPREYLVPDRDKITKALFADILVPGAELKKVTGVDVI